MKIQSLSEI